MSDLMSDAPNDALEPAPPADVVMPRRSPIRRVGCAILLVIWFVVLLLPCMFGLLLTRGEIMITTGSAPNQTLRLWLISEADERGLGLSSASVYSGANNNELCVQTDVRYLLWAGRAEPVGYCECYTRSAPDQPWEYTDAIDATCPINVEAQP